MDCRKIGGSHHIMEVYKLFSDEEMVKFINSFGLFKNPQFWLYAGPIPSCMRGMSPLTHLHLVLS